MLMIWITDNHQSFDEYHNDGGVFMKKNPIINTVLYFILYSLSLSAAWFEFGLEYPTVDGIGFIWLFPAVYLILFLISIRFVFVRKDNAMSYLRMGASTIGFICVSWGISALASIGKTEYQLREILYPASLFAISLLIFVLYVYEYVKLKRKR